MKSVSGYTKQELDDIDSGIITGASISGNTITLSKKGGGSILVKSSNLRGPTGAKGSTGPVTQSQVDDYIAEKLGVSQWVNLPLSSPWIPNTAGSQQLGPPRCRLEGDRVYLSGTVQYTGSTLLDGTLSYITSALNVKFRPLVQKLIVGMRQSGTLRVQADVRMYTSGRLGIYFDTPTAGDIAVISNGSLVYLDGLSYPIS